VVIHHRDGHVDSFQFGTGGAMAATELTVEVGQRIQERLATWRSQHPAPM
jgi:hypothetical protein